MQSAAVRGAAFLRRCTLPKWQQSMSMPACARMRSASAQPELPAEVDAVIIGGGSLGASCAYHLREKGMSTLLLERHQLTAGTTWHSAGMLWSLRPTDTDNELCAHSRYMCKKLEKETDTAVWTENGGLFVACNKERLDEYKRFGTLGQYYGTESHILSPKETQELYPILNVSDIYGAMYSPTDGTIDPTSVVVAYQKAATKLGARFVEGVGIEGFDIENYSFQGRNVRRVTGVHAAGQRIKTNVVVNCTGAWANEIANMAGVTIPLRAMKHAYIVTEKIEGVHAGLPNLRDHDLSIYFTTRGESLFLGGYEQNPEFWPDVDPEFSFGLFELDWDTFGQNMDGHIKRCPLVETTGIQSTVCGPEAFTPDHKPLVGPDPELRGFVHCCGFNSMGMMLGGGVGREVAAWITEGAPNLDMFSLDVARFHPSTTTNRRWVEDRTHESYAKTYSIVFPHDEPLAGRQIRKSSLYDTLLQQGCVYQSRQGFERPGFFAPHLVGGKAECMEYDFYGAYANQDNQVTGLGRESLPLHEEHPYYKTVEDECTFGWGASLPLVAAECEGVRTGVALFDQSYFGKFFLEGPQATQAADWLCTARMDPEARPVGSVAYTALCNAKGGVMSDLTFTRLADDKFYIAAGGSTFTHDWRWISSELEKTGLNATLRDATDEYTMISVQGPYSRQLLKDLVDVSLDEEAFPFSTCQHARIAGHELMMLRLTFVGELGYELHVPAASAVKVYETIMQAAKSLPKGVPVVNSGYRAIDSCSAEKSYRHWHADLTNRDTPFEAGIGFVALAKLKTSAPFLGREALEKQRAEGLRRKLACLTLDEERPETPLHGREVILRNGQPIGFIRSTAFGFGVGKQVAYGYVDAPGGEPMKPKEFNAWLKEGTYTIGDRGAIRPATFHLKAPFDPSNKRIKGEYPAEIFAPKEASGKTREHFLDPIVFSDAPQQ